MGKSNLIKVKISGLGSLSLVLYVIAQYVNQKYFNIINIE